MSQLFRRHQALEGMFLMTFLTLSLTTSPQASHTLSVRNSPFCLQHSICLPDPYCLRSCLFHLSKIIPESLLPSPCCVLPLVPRTSFLLLWKLLFNSVWRRDPCLLKSPHCEVSKSGLNVLFINCVTLSHLYGLSRSQFLIL